LQKKTKMNEKTKLLLQRPRQGSKKVRTAGAVRGRGLNSKSLRGNGSRTERNEPCWARQKSLKQNKGVFSSHGKKKKKNDQKTTLDWQASDEEKK